MNSKVRGALLIVVLFVIASSVLFAQTREFDASHIDVTLLNPGPDGPNHVIIGTTIKVELEDPDIGTPIAIESATADFSQFEGPTAEAMVWDDDDQRWKAEYTVGAGSLENATAKVKITASKENGDGQITQDDTEFSVDNIASDIEGLAIDVEIVDAGPTDAAIVGSTIQVTFTSSEIISAKVNFQTIGGGLVDMTQVDSTFTAEYTVEAGNFTGDYTVEVLAYMAGNPNPGIAAADEAILVDNWVPDDDAFEGESYLVINNDPDQHFIHSGDTITVNATLDPRVKKAKIDWGDSNDREDVEYDVVNGVLTASYTPATGELDDTDDFEIAITWLKTENGNESDVTFSYVISGAQDGVPIAVDTTAPDLTGGWDLYYNPANGLRFSHDADSVDGYGTTPDTFTIMLKLPDWGEDGATEFTLRFVSENRLSFLKTYTAASAELTDNGGGLLEVLWDGRDADGNPLEFDALTTIGITLWEVKDAAGNAVNLEYVTGPEFPPDGDINVAANHTLLDDNEVILNRIHVVVDNQAPEYLDNHNLALVNSNQANIIRLINDENDDGEWNDGEAVYYNTAAGVDGSQQIDVSFRTTRQVTVDTNELRHETQNYWIFAENASTTWFYNGTDWEDMDNFDFATALHEVPFTGNAANSDIVNVTLDLGDEYDTPFIGAADPGVDYELYAYVQDNAGNITKSDVVALNIQHQFMKTPIVNRIELTSIHESVEGGLAQYNGEVKNFYLSAEYAPEDAPYTGEYYTSQDELTFEIEVNNSTFLKESDSVELRFTASGEEIVSYLQKSDFVDNVATITIPVSDFTVADGALTPGTLWGIGGDNDTTNYIQVTSYAIEYSVNGTSIAQSFVAEDGDEFYLVIPPKPNFPPTDPNEYNLTAEYEVFSPGNPMNTYDAETNYAFDGTKDSNELSFVVPEGDNILWRLEVLQGTEVAKSWEDRIPHANNTAVSRTFENLSNAAPDIEAIVANGESEALTVKLSILPDPMSDPGYTDPPTGITPDIEITVDNQNPYVLPAEASVASIDDNVITLTTGVPVVSSNANSFSFDLVTNEALGTVFAAGDGNWNILLKKSDNTDVTNSGNPVTAAISSVESLGANLYSLTVVIDGIAGITPEEAEDAILVLMLPWDEAQNPGRYNDPTLPYAADMWHNDSAEYYLPLNIVPDIPEISNVTINDPDLIFVPGEDLEVAWEMVNWEDRDIALTIELSVGDEVIGTATIDSGFAAEMYEVFTAFNPGDIDGETITATISGTVDYDGIVKDLVPQTATIEVDIQPEIESLVFEKDAEEIRTLMNGMDEITITAEINSPNALAENSLELSNADIDLTEWTLPTPTVTDLGEGLWEVKWTGVAIAEMAFEEALLVSDFVLAASTPHGYAAEDYIHQMVLINEVTSELNGVVANERTPYEDIDPAGWFAPEHNVVAEYHFVSFEGPTGPTDEVAPIWADFDEIEDNIASNLILPSTSTITEYNIPLTSGSADTLDITLYEYTAGWDIEPDVQSVWNRYDDGEAIEVTFEYELVTGSQTDIKEIKVDLRVPMYDNQLWIAQGTTPPTSYQPLMNGFPGPSPEISIALNPDGSWPAGQSIYLKYIAMDGSGSGVLDIVNPTNPTGWTVAEVSYTQNPDGTAEKVISLTPNVPANLNGQSTMTLHFGTVQDAVGHMNYGGPLNSTDPNWVDTPPVLNFNFRSDYATTHQMIRAFKYINGDRQDWTTAPYVQAGAPIGLMLELKPVAQDLTRGTDVQSIDISSVELNTKFITNVTGGTDNWVTLAKDPNTGLYYLNNDYNVDINYAHEAGINMQYRINYLIQYTDGSTSVPPPFVSDVIPDVARVDKQIPEFIFANNDPTNPENQRSIFYWSESLGSAQEGYVVPGDTNGQLYLIFKDDNELPYEDEYTAKPSVVISGLNEFVAGMPVDYSVPASNLSYHDSYSLTVGNNNYNYNNVWVAALDGLDIISQIPPIFSATISYSITDVVGNNPITGDRMVEIAANGPIVPIIREARLHTVVPGTGTDVYNYIAQDVNATLEVFIDVEFAAYIEDVWVEELPGVVDFGDKSNPVLVTQDEHNVPNITHDLWKVSIPVYPVNVNANDNINLVVHTKRNPFGADLFTGTYVVTLIVDGRDYALDNTVVSGISSTQNIEGMLGPNAAAEIVAHFSDIGELIVANGDDSLPDDIADWFVLQN
ncbi:MAG: large repetitive protein, partial [Candidatus Cloacimonadota bacterium]|nr:large repetitive protein [Candidatus Cloacimonadota bacterium]